MAKSKVKKTKKFSKSTKRNLFIVGLVLICVGVLIFLLENKKAVTQETNTIPVEYEESAAPKALGPSQGCNLVGTNYICDIKITNPKSESLEWSSIITGIDGATISNGGYGSVEASGSTVVQLSLPKAFCDKEPEGTGIVQILEDKKSSNQDETEFSCSPAIPTNN